jgi:hypothetical protein
MMRAKQLDISNLHLPPDVGQTGDARQTVMSVARRLYHVERQTILTTTHGATSTERRDEIRAPLVRPRYLTRFHGLDDKRWTE